MPNGRWIRQALGLIMPIDCLGCGRESDWICPDCRASLRLHREELCFCGKAGENGLCPKHRQQLGLDGLTTLFGYAEPTIQKLIRRLKYHAQIDTVNFLADHFQRVTLSRLPRGEWVVTPIPLSRERSQGRGFNQSELIAKHLTAPLYDYSDLLLKTRETAPQAKLNKTQRQSNIVRALAVQPRVDIPERVIIVDDVVTTGSTLKEAARALRKGGAQEVWALTLAHG